MEFKEVFDAESTEEWCLLAHLLAHGQQTFLKNPGQPAKGMVSPTVGYIHFNPLSQPQATLNLGNPSIKTLT